MSNSLVMMILICIMGLPMKMDMNITTVNYP